MPLTPLMPYYRREAPIRHAKLRLSGFAAALAYLFSCLFIALLFVIHRDFCLYRQLYTVSLRCIFPFLLRQCRLGK